MTKLLILLAMVTTLNVNASELPTAATVDCSVFIMYSDVDEMSVSQSEHDEYVEMFETECVR